MTDLRDRAKGALLGAFIADAMAMPSHWFYGGRRQVRSMYGKEITGFTRPTTHLPGSIMSKSSTGGGGRGGYGGDIIGSVIFHGKKKFWAPGADYHYHHALDAGENTLDATLARRLMNVLASSGGGGGDWERSVLEDFVEFLTTPGSHNDTYCSTSIRMFFANRAAGLPLEECPDNDGHNVDTIDALVMPLALALWAGDEEVAAKEFARGILLTRASSVGSAHASVVTRMVRRIVSQGPEAVEEAVMEAARAVGVSSGVSRTARAREDPVTACYLSSSFPAALGMALKYHALHHRGERKAEAASDAFTQAMLANANRGGENVGTGVIIGAVLGASCGYSGMPKEWVDALKDSKTMVDQVDAFLDASPYVKESMASKM